MLNKDGNYQIYTIQHLPKLEKETEENWVFSNFDSFGFPDGFDACGECWQKTGIYGTFEIFTAKKGFDWIMKRNPDTKFRVVKIFIQQMTVPLDW